jgi:hypothetical protein
VNPIICTDRKDFPVRNFESDCEMLPICTNLKFQGVQSTVLQLSKEGWTKLFPHLSRASDHLIMQCFTSLKPPYIVGPVCFGLFGYNLGKNMFYSDFEK